MSRSAERGSRMKIGRNVSCPQVLRPTCTDAISWWLSRRPFRRAMCNVQSGGEEWSGNGRGQKARNLPGSVVRRNARHPQFTGNQRRECFVAVQGDEPDAPFIPRCHRRIISPRARTSSSSPSLSLPSLTFHPRGIPGSEKRANPVDRDTTWHAW